MAHNTSPFAVAAERASLLFQITGKRHRNRRCKTLTGSRSLMTDAFDLWSRSCTVIAFNSRSGSRVNPKHRGWALAHQLHLNFDQFWRPNFGACLCYLCFFIPARSCTGKRCNTACRSTRSFPVSCCLSCCNLFQSFAYTNWLYKGNHCRKPDICGNKVSG